MNSEQFDTNVRQNRPISKNHKNAKPLTIYEVLGSFLSGIALGLFMLAIIYHFTK